MPNETLDLMRESGGSVGRSALIATQPGAAPHRSAKTLCRQVTQPRPLGTNGKALNSQRVGFHNEKKKHTWKI